MGLLNVSSIDRGLLFTKSVDKTLRAQQVALAIGPRQSITSKSLSSEFDFRRRRFCQARMADASLAKTLGPRKTTHNP
jgi:hypothetical protein